MDRESLGPLILAAVCVLAVAFAAATVATPTQTGSGELGTGEGGGDGIGDDPGGSGIDVGGDEAEQDGFLETAEGEPFIPLGYCLTFLFRPEVVLGIVAAFLLFGYLMKRRYDNVAAVGMVATFSLPVFLVYILMSACRESAGPLGLPESIVGGGAGNDGSVGLGDPGVPVDPTSVPLLVYVVLGLVLVGVLAYAFSSRGRFGGALEPIWSKLDDETVEGDPAGGVAATIGELAGEAADRIEDDTGTSVENEVYRAWREMTDSLDVDRPESSTPAEFATAAVEGGVSRRDVDELTELFEEVRYGGYDPDEDRERRAVDALRRIEEQYTDEEERP